jgi:hypothetical protein
MDAIHVPSFRGGRFLQVKLSLRLLRLAGQGCVSFLLGVATSQHVRNDQLYRRATPRHIELFMLTHTYALNPEPADGAPEVSQKDSLRLRTVQKTESKGNTSRRIAHRSGSASDSLSTCCEHRLMTALVWRGRLSL